MSDIIDELLGGTTTRPAPAPDRCHQCQAPRQGHCASCRLPACKDHLWTMLGICLSCAREDRIDRFQREGRVEETNWLEEPPGAGPGAP